MFSNLRQRYQVMKDHSKSTRMHFWMIQRAKIEVFGHFLEFGLLDRLDIAYGDRIKCFSTFGNLTRSRRIIQKSQKSIFEWSKGQKETFLAIFWSLVIFIYLILNILIELNVFQYRQHYQAMKDHSKITKMHFLVAKWPVLTSFGPFSRVWSNGVTSYILFR